MENNDICIRNARSEDAPQIASAIMSAIGMEICDDFAKNASLQKVHQLFASLAQRTDTQYSYLNAMIAETEAGETAGVCVAYDGARLAELRKPFIEEAKRLLQWEFRKIEDECAPDEFYLDTLCVFEAFRRRGIAAQLIRAAEKRANENGKPLGLLVDKDNDRARALYDKCGFVKVGERPFAGVIMDSLRIPQQR